VSDNGWFVIRAGENEGRAHLRGWMLSAILTLPTGSKSDPPGGVWWSFAHCPRCCAVVQADDKGPYGDLTWAHERWHAATDYPIPPDVAAQVTRP